MKRSWLYSVALTLMTVMLASGCSMNRLGKLPWSSTATSQPAFDQQLSLARLSERHGKGEEAANIYKAVIANEPGNPLAHHRLGVMAAKQGEYAQALMHFNTAALAGPPSSELLGDIGYAYYLAEDFTQAEGNLRAAIALDPNNKWARNNLGLVLGETGKYKESLAEFRRTGSEAEAFSNLAYIQSQAGELQEAETNYHRALNLDSSLRTAAEALLQVAAQTGSLGNPGNDQRVKPNEMLAEASRLANAASADLASEERDQAAASSVASESADHGNDEPVKPAEMIAEALLLAAASAANSAPVETIQADSPSLKSESTRRGNDNPNKPAEMLAEAPMPEIAPPVAPVSVATLPPRVSSESIDRGNEKPIEPAKMIAEAPQPEIVAPVASIPVETVPNGRSRVSSQSTRSGNDKQVKPTEMIAKGASPEIVAPAGSVPVEKVQTELPLVKSEPTLEAAIIATSPQMVVRDVEILPASAMYDPQVAESFSPDKIIQPSSSLIETIDATAVPISEAIPTVVGGLTVPVAASDEVPIVTSHSTKADGTRAVFRLKQPGNAAPRQTTAEPSSFGSPASDDSRAAQPGEQSPPIYEADSMDVTVAPGDHAIPAFDGKIALSSFSTDADETPASFRLSPPPKPMLNTGNTAPWQSQPSKHVQIFDLPPVTDSPSFQSQGQPAPVPAANSFDLSGTNLAPASFSLKD